MATRRVGATRSSDRRWQDGPDRIPFSGTGFRSRSSGVVDWWSDEPHRRLAWVTNAGQGCVVFVESDVVCAPAIAGTTKNPAATASILSFILSSFE